MKTYRCITTQAVLFAAACVVASGPRAEDSSLGRPSLPNAVPVVQAPDTVAQQPAASDPNAAPAGAQRAEEWVAAPKRLPGVFASSEEERLERQRGGADTHIETTTNTNNATATVSNNTAANLTTGNNVIRDGSLTNNSGIPMVIQNSGNNVVIQNSTILNLRLQ